MTLEILKKIEILRTQTDVIKRLPPGIPEQLMWDIASIDDQKIILAKALRMAVRQNRSMIDLIYSLSMFSRGMNFEYELPNESSRKKVITALSHLEQVEDAIVKILGVKEGEK